MAKKAQSTDIVDSKEVVKVGKTVVKNGIVYGAGSVVPADKVEKEVKNV